MQPDVALPILDGKYQLLRQLSEGGMGSVYEALHRGTGRNVAVKVIAGEALAKNPEVVARFQREVMATGKVQSQYIAHVLDTGVDSASGSPYLVMELLVGEDLHDVIKRLGVLTPELALRVIAQACLGLQKAHEAGIIHRDIKPANLFLATRDAGEMVVKVLDFGIAKVKMAQAMSTEPGADALTRAGTMLGSPHYMSPEQALGTTSLDHRTDLWSLGVVLYELLAGVTPTAGAPTMGALIMQLCSQPPRLVQEHAPWVSPEVAAIVHKALAMDPEVRFRSAAEMFGAIKTLLPGGIVLDESMFVKVSTRTKSIPAPRFGVPSEAMRPPARSFNGLPEVSVDPDRKVEPSTADGFGHSWRPPPPVSKTYGRSLALTGVLVVGLGVLFVVGRALMSTPSTNTVGLVTGVNAVAPPPMAASVEVAPTPESTVRLPPGGSSAVGAPLAKSRPPAPRPIRPPMPAPPPAVTVATPVQAATAEHEAAAPQATAAEPQKLATPQFDPAEASVVIRGVSTTSANGSSVRASMPVGALTTCYRNALRAHGRPASGSATLTLLVDGAGKVWDATLTGGDWLPEMVACVRDVVTGVQLPPGSLNEGETGGTAEISLSFRAE